MKRGAVNSEFLGSDPPASTANDSRIFDQKAASLMAQDASREIFTRSLGNAPGNARPDWAGEMRITLPKGASTSEADGLPPGTRIAFFLAKGSNGREMAVELLYRGGAFEVAKGSPADARITLELYARIMEARKPRGDILPILH